MSVKKIFVTLGTIVACVIVIAFVINILLPNATAQLVNAVEDSIYNATGFSFDLNGDGQGGQAVDEYNAVNDGSDDAALNDGGAVEGYWQ